MEPVAKCAVLILVDDYFMTRRSREFIFGFWFCFLYLLVEGEVFLFEIDWGRIFQNIQYFWYTAAC